MKTQAEYAAANQFHAYQQGWVAGARIGAMDPQMTSHTDALVRAAYNRGYADGRAAWRTAMQEAANRYGHRISVVHLMTDKGPDAT